MTATTHSLARTLQDGLGLDTPPVALAFVHEAPAGVAPFAGSAPSACAFWRLAERGVFYASAQDHFNCPVGVMTMGFEMPPEKGEELMGLVGEMCRIGYMDEAEAANIPSVPGAKSGIVYGPLAEFPGDPDLILVWLQPYQAMLLSEAAGASNWAGARGVVATGRPACAALPRAINEARAAMSFGCIGMRTYTDVARGMLLAALPLASAQRLAENLPIILEANARMEQFYQGRKAQFQ